MVILLKKTISVTLSGVDGAEQIKAIMAKFRNNVRKNSTLLLFLLREDFKAQTSTAADGTVQTLTTHSKRCAEIHTWLTVLGLLSALWNRTKNQVLHCRCR